MSSRPTYKRFRSVWILPVLLAGAVSMLAFLPAEDWTTRIIASLQQFNQRYPQEKVYLHLDKDYYAAGETIWFKAYITLQSLPAVQATNLYVELLDRSGNVVQKKMFAASNGGAAGNIDLPETQAAGSYQLRAYTAYMLNFDPAFLYTRTLEIFDPQKAAPRSKDTAAAAFAIQFFPEGGNLVAGQDNQVAFKAIDQNGYPIAVNGTVKGSKGAAAAAIKTKHDGMGVFTLQPAPGETYVAEVKAANGQSKSVALPAAIDKGISLRLYNKGARIFYQSVLAENLDTSFNQLLIVAQMNHQLVYKAMLNPAEGRISGFIPTDRLPSGILQVTLFDKSARPLAERLAFVRQNDLLAMDVWSETQGKGPRQKNSFTIRLPDTLQSNISVAVTDADEVPKDPSAGNIISNILLTSDIRGYVYNPAWYFRNTEPATLEALDLVMMTNGWRRFSWEKIIQNDFPAIRFPYEQGIQLKGSAWANNGRNPLANGKVDMMIKVPYDSSSFFASAPLDEKGEFVMNGLVFPDTALVYYQGNDPQKRFKDVMVQVNKHFFENGAGVKTPFPLGVPTPVDNAILKTFLTTVSEKNKVNRAINSRMVYLKEVDVKARKPVQQQTTEQRYTSGMFTGDNGYTFDLTKETPTAFNIFQYLQSKVPGLNITGDPSNPSIAWRGGRPALYLNEMNTDISMISGININDIALVKVFRPPFMGGFGGANGAIAIYTKKGGDNTGNDQRVRGFELVKKAGYSIVKEFYSPDYSVKKDVHSLPDKRLTLYWNPQVKVDSLTHMATFEFYNNDFSKRFRVVAEGITDEGNVGRVEQEF